MKLDDDEYIYDIDDYNVDFSRKRRVHKNYQISKNAVNFAPEDPSIETNKGDFNPSVNHNAYKVSGDFEGNLNNKGSFLNKGETKEVEERLSKDRMPSRDKLAELFNDIFDDYDETEYDDE